MIRMQVLDPRGDRTGARPDIAPRLDRLEGTTLGVVMIHFPWHSWYLFADRLVEMASERSFTVKTLDLSHSSEAHFTGAGQVRDEDREREELLAFGRGLDAVVVGLGN
jgi:hypothetical protein